MVVAREQYQALIARAFDGAIVVDGQRVVAHKSGMHVIRGGGEQPKPEVVRTPHDHSSASLRDAARPGKAGTCDRDNDWSDV